MTYLVISLHKTEAVDRNAQIRAWCTANCRSHWTMFPPIDPVWRTVITQGFLGFEDANEAMLFRLSMA